MIPSTPIQTDVNFRLLQYSDAIGTSPSDFTTQDLQTLAYGLRLSCIEQPDLPPDQVDQMYQAANAIDGLSDLDQAAQDYLMAISN